GSKSHRRRQQRSESLREVRNHVIRGKSLVDTGLVTENFVSETPSRAEQIRSFLRRRDLKAWVAWRPDELLMLSGYFPFWGASLLIYFADAEPLLFVPQIEPRDHVPDGLRVQEYPWGDMKCSDPYAVLVSMMGSVLEKAGAKPENV